MRPLAWRARACESFAAPVEGSAAYVEQLSGQRLAKSLTAEQLAGQLEAQGVDLKALTDDVLPELTPAQRKLAPTVLSHSWARSCPSPRWPTSPRSSA